MSWSFTSRSLPFPICQTAIHPLLVLVFTALSVASSLAEAVFHIECPPDTTVGCDAEIWDLSGFGTAYIYGYNGPQPAGDPISVHYNLNDCGTGTIVRTWVAYDYGGHPHYCSQTIYVTGGGYLNIHWPPDYTIKDCNPGTDPDHLPPPFNYPTFYNDECAQLMFNYEDQVFNINPPACIKILRKWTVIDWCQYDPNDYHPSGIWTHTQVIKVKPKNPPTILCPADVTVTAGGDCTGGYVNLPKATGMADCGADVIITNHSPYADSGGADASGFYPLGTTKVTFKASDGCGGQATCSMYITVKDMKAPTPICYYGVSIALMQMPDGYYMDLRPEFFNKGSFDNCTPDHKLVFDIEPKRVDCNDIGTIPVKVFVTDESGNSAHCNTIVNVQDNLDICPDTDGLIAGSVTTLDGAEMQDVMVELENSGGQYQMTDTSGAYLFSDVPFGEDYTVTPEYELLDMEGVTVIDLVVLLKHISGMAPIDDPYLFMAADVNATGDVNVHDLIAIKDLILQDYFGHPVGTRWDFIDAAYQVDIDNPLGPHIPHAYSIQGFSSDMNNLNFVGIKTGDISGDLNYSTFNDELVSRASPVQLVLEDIILEDGDVMEIPIALRTGVPISAIQYSLEFGRDIDILDVLPRPGNTVELQGNGERNTVAGLRYELEPFGGAEEYVLGYVRIRANSKVYLREAITAHGQQVNLAYGPDNARRDVALVFEPEIAVPDSDQEHHSIVGEAFPNPFGEITHIPITLQEQSQTLVEVFDAQGKRVLSQKHDLSTGQHLLTIASKDLSGGGMYVCRITAGAETRSLRILSLTRD